MWVTAGWMHAFNFHKEVHITHLMCHLIWSSIRLKPPLLFMYCLYFFGFVYATPLALQPPSTCLPCKVETQFTDNTTSIQLGALWRLVISTQQVHYKMWLFKVRTYTVRITAPSYADSTCTSCANLGALAELTPTCTNVWHVSKRITLLLEIHLDNTIHNTLHYSLQPTNLLYTPLWTESHWNPWFSSSALLVHPDPL